VPKVLSKNGFWWILCPACKVNHRFDTRWTYNFDENKPTFNPRLQSLTMTADQPNRFCFARVKEGYIIFDPTCTHDLAGHAVQLPDWDEASWEEQKKALNLELNRGEVSSNGQDQKGPEGDEKR
jgi:hypothetical protein